MDDSVLTGTFLSNFEAHSRFSELRKDNLNRSETRKLLFDKAMAYAEQFAQFSSDGQHDAARVAIRDKLLERDIDDDREYTEDQDEFWRKQVEYDTVMLLNLCPTSVEQAKAICRTLVESRKSDDQIQEILDDLDRFRG
jgi:DNA-directed RNA polymerase subunit F